MWDTYAGCCRRRDRLAAGGAAAAYTAARPPAPAPAAPQPPYAGQPQYGAAPPGAPQYGYVKESGPWGRLFDFSFQGFVTPSSLKMLYIIVLGLIGLYVLFNIILVAMIGGRYAVISFFISLCAAVLWFFLSRVFFELMATVLRIRDKN